MIISVGTFGITKYSGIVGNYEQEHIVCDDYKEYIDKLEAQNPNITAIIIDDIQNDYIQ